MPTASANLPPLCEKCQQVRVLCFCDAPRCKELYEKRLRWAIIEHPASDDFEKRIARVLAEPEKPMDLAKELERENTVLREEIAERDRRDFDAMAERPQ